MSAQTNQFAIETVNLTKNYTSKTKNPLFRHQQKKTIAAINNLNLKIKQGELFGLLGPNGAGKTTLVKVLCTLLPPDQGTATVNGYDVEKQQMQVKKSLGTIFSVGERGFFWRLTGYSNLEFYAAINNVPRQGRKERILKVLDLVGMKENAYEHFQKYSGGMKRKLALSRALLADPPILLLDEPTAGLDVMSSRAIRDFIKNDLVKKSGKTVLYTTHYIEEAAQMCDTIGILRKGQLIAQDTPDALKTRTKKGEVVDIIAKNMTPNQTQTLRNTEGIEDLTAETQNATIGQTHLRMHLKNVDSLPAIIDYFFKEKIKIVSFKQEESTLEDAFLEISGANATS